MTEVWLLAGVWQCSAGSMAELKGKKFRDVAHVSGEQAPRVMWNSAYTLNVGGKPKKGDQLPGIISGAIEAAGWHFEYLTKTTLISWEQWDGAIHKEGSFGFVRYIRHHEDKCDDDWLPQSWYSVQRGCEGFGVVVANPITTERTIEELSELAPTGKTGKTRVAAWLVSKGWNEVLIDSCKRDEDSWELNVEATCPGFTLQASVTRPMTQRLPPVLSNSKTVEAHASLSPESGLSRLLYCAITQQSR